MGCQVKLGIYWVSYKKLRESAAASIVNPIKVCIAVNQYDIITKSTLVGTTISLSDASHGVNWGEGQTTSP